MEAGATLAASLGVTAAVLSPDPVWGNAAAFPANVDADRVATEYAGADAKVPDPDAELIAACDRFIQAAQVFEDDDSGLDFDVNPLCHEMEAAEKAAQAIPARTMAGVIAKARVAVAMGTSRDGTVRLGNSYAGEWPGDVVRDVLRIAGLEVPA